jgi:hypothetical protein
MVAVTIVLAVGAMLAGLAETVVVVETDVAGAVTVTVVVALEPENPITPAYIAVITLLPVTSLPALTVSEALPELLRVADPRVVPPRLKVTVPVGVPLDALTVAVRTVLPVVEMEAGLADRVVVVLAAAPVTVTVAVPVDPLNVALPA